MHVIMSVVRLLCSSLILARTEIGPQTNTVIWIVSSSELLFLDSVVVDKIVFSSGLPLLCSKIMSFAHRLMLLTI